MHPLFDVPAAHRAAWPARVPWQLPRCETTLWDNLDITARRYPEKAALVFFGRFFSYAELHREVEKLAGWLMHEAGVQHGDRVLVALQNSPQLVIAYLGILRAGAVIVPSNPMSRAGEFAHSIGDSGARVAIVAADLLAHVAASADHLSPAAQLAQIVVTRYCDAMPDVIPDEEQAPAAWQSWLDADPVLPAHAVRWTTVMERALTPAAYRGHADDLAAICYTSGTTGKPKGCMHTHRSLGHNVRAGPLWNGTSASDVMLGVVPAFHITGMQFCVHQTLYLGSTVVLMPRWDRDLAGRLIARHQVTGWTNIPTMVIDLLASPHLDTLDLSSLRYIGGGGAAMPEAVAARLRERYGLDYVEGYGLTETAAPSHSNPPQAARRQCLGIPYVGVDSRVVDPDSLRALPPGETGEIVIHGPQLFVGYWQRPEETEQAFLELEGKRFFRTGDLGRVDADGYFYIADRLKRMINASGFKVWPAEVENQLFAHPAIQEACVIGTRDAYRGETVKAVVVLRADYRGRVSAEEIEHWSRERMAAFKVPRVVEFADALPKSGSGKVMWRLLQEEENARATGSS